MKRKQFFLMAAALSAVLQVNAQGNNTDMGGPDGDYRSLADRVLKLEKKTDAFNLYLNYAAAAQVRDESGSWTSGFVNKQLRLEIKGNLTDRLFYRLCHRLNKSNTAKGADNFAKATDIMLVGYHLDNKWTVEAGKICQHWGGFEFDINPMYIYEFSDMVGSMDCYMAGVSVAYRLVPTQELVVDITNTDNGTLDEDNAALTLRNIRAAFAVIGCRLVGRGACRRKRNINTRVCSFLGRNSIFPLFNGMLIIWANLIVSTGSALFLPR